MNLTPAVQPDRQYGKRLTQRLLRALPARETQTGHAPAQTEPLDLERVMPGLELAERPDMDVALQVAHARVARRDWLDRIIPDLPDALLPVPGRVARDAQVEAAGFADRQCPSVGVDLACWNTPPQAGISEHAWRRVFTWVVAADRELRNVAVLSAPIWDGDSVTADYGYEAEGVPGIGVLRVTALPDGRWRIVDCWGDATDASRVYELAGLLADRCGWGDDRAATPAAAD